MPRRETKGFAAYRKDADFLPFGSIGASAEYAANWIERTYQSGKDLFQVVPVTVIVKRTPAAKRKKHK